MSDISSSPTVSPDNLPPDHYIVAVRHPFPELKTLRDEFAPYGGFVAKVFDGRPWEKHPRCKDVSEKNSGRIMRLAWPQIPVTAEEAIAFAGVRYRPATHIELLAFGRTHPTFQQRFWIVGLGSTVLHNSIQHVAVLEGDIDGRRILESYPRHARWTSRRRFLFVYEG